MTWEQPVYPGRVALQQRVFASYRKPFFEVFAKSCRRGLSVFAGLPGMEEGILPGVSLEFAQYEPAHNHHFLRAESRFYVCWQTGWLKWLAQWQPNALVVEANSRTESTRFMINWMRTRKRPVLGWGLGKSEPRRGIIGLISKWDQYTFLRSLDGVIAYSERGASAYRSLGFPTERVFIAPNAVSAKPIHAIPNRPLEFNGKPIILFVGRLQERKRIDNLLRACAALPLQPRLIIIGDGPALAGLQKLAKDVYPAAEFLGAKVGSELEPYFIMADLFVLPGTGGLAVQQAMTYGLPVIVAEADGTQENLVSSSNGILIRPNQVDSLIQAITYVLEDIPRLRQMGQESYRIVREEINLEAMVSVFVKALAKAMTWQD